MATTVDLGRVIGPTGPKGEDLVHKTYILHGNNSEIYIPTGWYAVATNISSNDPLNVKFKIVSTAATVTPVSIVKSWTDNTSIGFLPTPDSDIRKYDFIYLPNSESTSSSRTVAYIDRKFNPDADITRVIFTKID